MHSEILLIIAPVFVIVAIGYGLEAFGLGFDSDSLSRLVIWVGTPALIFSSLTRTELPDEALARMMGLAVVVVLIGGAVAVLCLLALRLPIRTFLPPLSLPNSGNAGLPVVFFAFSDDGLAIGAAFFFTIALTQYTVGPAIVAGKFSLRKLLTEPLVWSIVAVVAFKLADAKPPRIVADTTQILSGIMIPVMLILLGGALARLKVRDMKVSVQLAAIRAVIGVAAGYAVITLFGLSGIEAGALFILAAMPSALVTYVFAERYKLNPERVAGVVVCSTVLTFAMLPLIVAGALKIAGA